MKRLLIGITLAFCTLPAIAQSAEVTIDGRRFTLTLTPLDPPAPGVGPIAPTGLGVERDQLGRVVVSWQDKSSDEAGFHLWRKSGVSGWQRIATTAANVNAYTDWGAVPGDHTYRVQSHKDTGASAFTPEVAFTVTASINVTPLVPTTHAYTTPDGAPVTKLLPGDTISIRGEAFGTEPGVVTVNYLPVAHRAWTDATILLRLPDTPLRHAPNIGIRRTDGRYTQSMLPWEWVTPAAPETTAAGGAAGSPSQ